MIILCCYLNLTGMKIATLITSALLSLSAIALGAEKLDDLKKERREINRAIRKAIPDAAQLDPELAKLQRASIEAQKVLIQALDSEPSFSSLNAEIKKNFDALVQARVDKNEAAQQAAEQKNSELNTRRNDEAAKIPELAKLMEANNAAGAAYFQREKEVIAAHPETKALASRLAEVNEAIQQEMKK